MRWPLQRKLFLTVGVGAAGLALVMSLLVDMTVVKEIQEHETRSLRRTQAAFEALRLHRRAQLLERCRLVSDLPYFQTAVAAYDPGVSPAHQVEAMAQAAEAARRVLNHVDVDLLALTRSGGIPLFTVGPAVERGVNDLSNLVVTAHRATQHNYADGYMALDQDLVHIAAVPVDVGGLELGALCLGTTLDTQLARSLEDMTGSAVALLAREGILARSESCPPGMATVLSRFWIEFAQTPQAFASRVPLRIAGSRYQTLWVPLHGPKGKLLGAFVVLRSEDHALAFLSNVRKGLVGIALTALLVALFYSYMFARQITTPIHHMVARTDQVARGNLEDRIRISTGDELALLGEAFNRMSDSLNKSRARLEESNRILQERSSELEEANRVLRQSKRETEAVNEELRKANAEVIQAGKLAALGELGAGIAHELRQPLAAIRGYAQLVELKLSQKNVEPSRYLKLIVQAVDHMTPIVQGLKDFARKSSFEFRDLDLNKVVENTVLLLRAQLSNRGIDLRMRLDPDLPEVQGNANQLQQVFTNLLGNARDALGTDGGWIEVETRALDEGSYVMASVRDSGPGVPPEVLPKIFQSFFTTKPEGEGTGLGLSITQAIVHDHGGRIDVTNPAGGGAVFRLFFPTRRAKNCWETIDCVLDCRPEVSGKEECSIYQEGRGHRCWEVLRELGRIDPRVSSPDCERCPVYMAKSTFVSPPQPQGDRAA